MYSFDILIGLVCSLHGDEGDDDDDVYDYVVVDDDVVT